MTSLLYDMERFLGLSGHLKALVAHTCKTAQCHAICPHNLKLTLTNCLQACIESCGFATSRSPWRERSSPFLIIDFHSCEPQIFFQGAEVAHYPLQPQAQRQVVLRLCSTQHDVKQGSKHMPSASCLTHLPFNMQYSTFYCCEGRRGTCRHYFHIPSWLLVRGT